MFAKSEQASRQRLEAKLQTKPWHWDFNWFLQYRTRREVCSLGDEPELATGFSRKMSLKGKDGMLGIDHRHGRHEATRLEQIRAFLAGSGEVRFAGQRREEMYGWVAA